MKEQGYQTQQAALSAHLEPSKLLLEMVAVLLVQLVKVQHLHSQHVQLVWLMSTVQMLETPVLPVTHPVKQQIQPLDKLNVVSVSCFLVTTFHPSIFLFSEFRES